MHLDTRIDIMPTRVAGKEKSYRFSTVVIAVFLVAMILVSGFVILTSYWGAKNVVDNSIRQLSERIRIIASLSFNQYVGVTDDIDDIIVSSNALIVALEEGDREQQEKILSGVYSSHQEGQLDILFLQSGNDDDIVDVSATVYSLMGLKEQVMAIPQSNFQKLLIVTDSPVNRLYAIMNKSVILAEKTGKVLAYVYTGVILNDNIEILNEIRSNTQADVVSFIYDGKEIASLSDMSQQTDDGTKEEKSSADHLVILSPLDLPSLSQEELILKISHPQSAVKVLERNYFRATYRIAVLVLMITVFFVWVLSKITRQAMTSLTTYAKEIAQDKKSARFKASHIKEFNDVGITLNRLIDEMAAAEDNLLRSNRELERMARVASAAKDNLKKSNVELAAANEELEEFAYRTSHDLRSPLVSSIALLGVAEEALDSKNKEMTLQTLSLVRDSLTKLELLIRDILILNEVKNKEEEYEEINVPDIVKESIKSLSNMQGFDRIDIRTDYNGPEILKTKKLKFQMVIDNLLSNAIKYKDPDKKKSYIEISTMQKGDRFILRVKDNGLGIPKDKRGELFEMFKRFHPKVSFGSGLGLYLIKKGAHAIGGDIRYKAHKDGSIFEFDLPFGDQDK